MRFAWSMRTLFLCSHALLLACALLVLAPRVAHAQSAPSVNGIAGTVLRIEPNGANADDANQSPHPSGVPDTDINFADCEADLRYEFQLLVSDNDPSYDLNVWAGTADCSVLANRQSATAVCWPVIAPVQATTNPTQLKVRMQDIVSQAFEASHDVNYGPATSNACQGQSTTGPTNLSLYFFYAQSDGTLSAGSVVNYPLTGGLLAAGVSGNISVGIGDTLLIVNVPPTSDPSVVQWNVYCDPPPSEASAVETVPVDAASNDGVCASQGGASDAALDSGDGSVHAGVDEAGGNACGVALNDAQIPSPGGCHASGILIPGGNGSYVDDAGETVTLGQAAAATDDGGAAPSYGTMTLIPAKYVCASVSASSTEADVRGLKNGNYYNVAVAAVDALGNVGPLSNVECAEPVPVNDFWKNYYGAGGQAGGGFCSTQGVGAPAGTGGLGALVAAAIVAVVRRRTRAERYARSSRR
jgi:hypothetical protein